MCKSYSTATKISSASFCSTKKVNKNAVPFFSRFLLLLLATAITTVGWSQSTANYTYSTGTSGSLVTDRNSNTVDMSTGTTQLVGAGLDATASSLTSIGFDFYFMAGRFTQFSVNEDGILQLGGTAVSTNIYTITGGTASLPRLAAFNADLRTGTTTGKIHYKLIGTAPNRTLVVEFKDMQLFYTSSAAAGTSTWQMRLYESTGVIEYVYGVMNASNVTTTNRAPSIGFYIGSSTNSFVSVLYAGNTASVTNPYAANPNVGATGNIGNLHSPTEGSRRTYTFIPPGSAGNTVATSLAAPTSLNFTGVTQSAMTANWTASSPTTGILKYAVFTSTDGGTNYTFQNFVNVGTNTFPLSSLTPGTTYTWKILAISEGGTSSNLTGSQATNPLAPLSGTKTIDNTLPTAGNNYASFTAAINDINFNGISGAVTFNVTAGQTFTEDVPALTATGTLSNQIVFQKSGGGANPVIRPTGTIGVNDAGVILSGSDYITFDGIDINIATGSAVEYGFIVRNASATNGAQNNTIKNTTITLNRSNGAAFGILQSTSSSFGAAVAATNATGANSNNKYYNLTIKNNNGGILLVGTVGFPDLSCEIGTTSCATRNSIGDPLTADDIVFNGAAGGSVFGIKLTNQSGFKVFNNDITNVTTSINNSVADGIFIDNNSATVALGTSEVNNNKISTVSSSSTGANANNVVRGIRINGNAFAGTITRVYNNFITNIQSGNTNATLTTRRIIGISLQPAGGGAGSGIYCEFNSVRIAATNLAVSNACFEMGTGSGPVFRVRNNIFANVTAAQSGGAKHYCWISTQAAGVGAAGSLSNYNDLYVTGTNGFVGLGNATDYATLSNWNLANSQDGNSISVDPGFTSATDLHATAVALNGAADPLYATNTSWATVDIDCASRPGVTDIGADEFTVNNDDAGVTAIIVNNPICPGSNAVQVTIRNYGTATLNSVLVDWTVNGNAQTQANPSVSIAPGASATVTIGNFNFVAGTTYSITASTLSPNGNADGNTSNDAATQGGFATGLSGTYTVGSGGNFTTITAAVAAYNARPVCGPVTFMLTDASYAGETFPITINANSGASATNTLTIKPSGTASISGSNATALFILNAADYVTINGSSTNDVVSVCPEVSPSRNLTITNTNTGTSSAVIWLQSNGANGATNNKVINCILVGSGANNTFAAVGSGSSTIGTGTLGNGNNSNEFSNNNISKVTFGIVSIGAAAGTKNTGTVIHLNQINSASPNQVSRGGILVGFESGISIQGNNIGNLSGASSNDAIAISLGTAGISVSTLTGNEVTGATVAYNKINNIRSADTYSVGGIVVVTTANAGTNNIYNNFINNVVTNGTSSDFGASILIGGGTAATNIHYNTISMAATLTGGAFDNFGIAVGGSNPVLDISNNIVVNTSTHGTGFSYALGFAYSTFTNLTSNNNNLFTSGVTRFVRTATLSNTGGTDYGTLAAWTTASSKDAASKNIQPVFVSSTDLHIDPTNVTNINNLNGTATVLSVTNDIDCASRDNSTPDIGADEFTAVTCSDASGGTASGSTSFCGSGTPTITASGFSSGVGSGYQWEYSNDNFNTNINDFIGQTNPAALTTGVVSSTTYYRLRVTCSTNSSTSYSNIITVTINPVPAVVTVSGAGTFCGSTTITASNGNDGTIYFQGTTSGGTSTATASASQTVTTSGTYYFRALSGAGCWGPEGSAVVVINPNPAAPTVTPASPVTTCIGNGQALTASAAAFSNQVILSENFNSTTAGTTTSGNLPGGWTGVNLTAGVRIWGVVPNAQTGSTLGGGNFLYCESDGYSTNRTRAEVITPVFSAVGYSSVNIKFKHYYNDLTSGSASDSARVYVSNDGGANWTLVQQYDTDQGTGFSSGGAVNATIPVSLPLNANMRVKLVYNSDSGGNDWYWAVDDFVIDGTAGAPISWTASPSLDAGLPGGAGTPSSANASITATPTATGTYTYTAIVTNPVTGCVSTGATTATITVNPTAAIASVTGSSPLCIGATTTYTANGVVLGGGTGTWSSDNVAVATVDNAGLVTAVSAGSANITYTITGGCGGTVSASAAVTVNANAAITSVTGSSPLCIGATTTYTANGVVLGGGTGAWSSDNAAVATVDNAGLVTAVSAGSANITYTITGGCGGTVSASASVTVNANAAITSVTGSSPLCIGATTTYTANGVVLSGGTGAWSSDNAAVATVDNAGLVTAVSAGSANITYTINGGCGGTVSASASVTVNPNANAGTVSGASTICTSTTTTFTSNGDAGGTWSSDNNAVATVNPTSGLVTAVAPGTANITYTVNSGCASPVSASASITVASGAAPVVTGTVNVCPLIGTGTPVVYTATSTGATSYNWIVPPTNVTIVSGQGTSTLTVLFLNGFAAQANKQLRVTATSACGVSAQTIYYLLAQTASTPGPITGPNSACPFINAGNATYSIAAVPASTSYVWTVPANASIVTGQGSTSITVSFNNSYATGAITVASVNDCGPSAVRSLTVTRNNPSTPGLISGPTNACPFITPSGAATYSVTAVPSVTSYTWTVPAGAIGLTGQGSNTISFTYPTGFTTGTVSVTASNGCGVSGIRTLTIGTLQPATPSVIDVIQLQACPNRVYSYTIASMPANAQSVSWTAPAGATILTGQGSTSITVSYPGTAVNGNVTATGVNNCGTSVARVSAVKLPACPPEERSADLFTKSGNSSVENMSVNIFPNPTTSDFKLQVVTAGKEEINVRILDIQGRYLKQITVMPYQTVNLGAELKAGSYLVEVKQGKTVKTTRVIKF